MILEKIFGKHKPEESVESLIKFMQYFYYPGNRSAKESEANLKNSLLELKIYDQHTSNGLLATKDGYFLTAKHCLEDIDNLEVYVGEGAFPIQAPIDKICIYSDKMDLALAKIDLDGPSEPIRYNISNLFARDMPVKILTRRDGKVIERYGLNGLILPYEATASDSQKLRRYSKGLSITNTFCGPGDSGGIVISPQAELLGFISGGKPDGTFANASPADKVPEMLDFYIKRHFNGPQ